MQDFITPLEVIFADKILAPIRRKSTYNMCSNNRYHKQGYDNTYYFDRFELSDLLPSFDEDIDYELTARLRERFWDDVRENEWEYMGLPELMFDINGYRIMPNTPLHYLDTRHDEIIDLLKNETDPEAISEYHDELMSICDSYVEEAKKLEGYDDKIKDWISGLKEYYSEFVLVENPDGIRDLVHKDWYEDFKKEEGWKVISYAKQKNDRED